MTKAKKASRSAAFIGFVQDYLFSNDLADETRRVYSRAIKAFLKYAKPWEDGWSKRAVRWKSVLKVAPSSQALYVIAARNYLEACIEKGLLKDNPLLGVKVRLYGYSSSRRVLSDKEVKSLLAGVSGKTPAELRDRAILVLMLYTGLRAGGVVTINTQDFEASDGQTILKYKSKGHTGRDSFVVVPKAAVKAIVTYLMATGRSLDERGPCFWARGGGMSNSTLRKMVTRRMKQAGLEGDGLCVHSLRHTAASKAIDAGADLMAVRDMLGHKSVKTTEMYVHNLKRVQDAAELKVDYDLSGGKKSGSKAGR